MRKIFQRILFIISIVIISFVLLFGYILFGLWTRFYPQRFKECDPYPLISSLEKMSDANFPEDIRDVKAAKTIPIEGATHFILKFNAEPENANDFLKPFLLGGYEYIFTLEDRFDYRKHPSQYYVPKWFKEEIRQGKFGYPLGNNLDVKVYIDTSNESFFIVYIKGYYIATHEEKHPMRISPSGLFYLTTEINKSDVYEYPCVKIIIKDEQGKLIQEIQTNVSDRMSWHINWGRKDTIILMSSEKGELRWKRQENNKWVPFEPNLFGF